MLIRLTYASMVTEGHGHADFLGIVTDARSSNAGLEIGGVIAFDGLQFIQILEGEEAVVRALFARIAIDRRNEGVVEIRHRSIDARHFRDWRMRPQPVVDVLLLAATLDDDSAAPRWAETAPFGIADRLSLALTQIARRKDARIPTAEDAAGV